MDQPKIERLLRLMKMLTANVEYSVDDIAARLDMSRRTIYRYIDTFRDAGFVIKKRGNCIRLDKESPHFKDISQLVHFTEEEAVILRRAIESIDDTNLLKQNLKRKLYSVYDSGTLADTIVKGQNASNVHALIEAIENHKQVVLHNYQSSHSISNRHVEPFAFTTNYVNIWCYDIDNKCCKIFKTAR
ncbi:MAG: HTH domain-containing protein, partial [Alistipes sp.]|nr:HTH domain-containing protein [Alistipes sp.]